jgi:uncharacterized membrane protein
LNQLSQLLYWGNVAHNLGDYCGWIGMLFFILMVVSFILCIICLCGWTDTRSCLPETREKFAKFAKKSQGYGILFAVIAVFIWAIGCFMPNQDTVYAIAASEMGGRIVNGQTASLANQALNAWLKKQIGDQAAPAASSSAASSSQ